MRLCFLLLLPCLALPVAAQRVGFGPKFGVPLRAPYPPGLGDDSPRAVSGGFVDVRLWGPLSVEFNPASRRIGFDVGREIPSVRFRSRTRILDLPLLGRFTAFRGRAIQPFISGGYVRRFSSETLSGDFMSTRELSGWTNGGAAGGGVSFAMGPVRIEPEYRYSNCRMADQSRQGAHDLLVGFRLEVPTRRR